MTRDGELWHLVEARREDGAPAMFRIRDLAPRPDLDRIFVVEMPYPATQLSRLPDAAAYRRLNKFEEQWLAPACGSLGWAFVAAKADDGSFFLYLYGAGDPNQMIEKLSPFDAALGFFDEHDPTWQEYAALRELIDQANALPQTAPAPSPPPEPPPAPRRRTKAPTQAMPAARAKAAAATLPRAATPTPTPTKAKPKRKPKQTPAPDPKTPKARTAQRTATAPSKTRRLKKLTRARR